MRWRKKCLWLVVVFAVSMVALFVVAWFVGGRLLAPANYALGPPPENLPIVVSTIESESGSHLAAWYIPADDLQATIILLHPIRANRLSMLGRAKLFYEAGYSILMVDLQAHGESPGESITVGYRERHNVRAAVDYARAINPDHRIGIVGRSLGGAASLLASPLNIDALVLESVYPTISEAIHNRVAMRLGPLSYVLSPILLMQFQPRLGIAPSDLRPIDHIADVGCPVLIAGGDLDEHTTLAETQRMYDLASEPKKLSIFEGVHHSDLLAENQKQYKAQVLTFLDTYLRAENK